MHGHKEVGPSRVSPPFQEAARSGAGQGVSGTLHILGVGVGDQDRCALWTVHLGHILLRSRPRGGADPAPPPLHFTHSLPHFPPLLQPWDSCTQCTSCTHQAVTVLSDTAPPWSPNFP